MTTRRFCKATSVFCLTTARLAPWPERKASFSRLKLETCACGGRAGKQFGGHGLGTGSKGTWAGPRGRRLLRGLPGDPGFPRPWVHPQHFSAASGSSCGALCHPGQCSLCPAPCR